MKLGFEFTSKDHGSDSPLYLGASPQRLVNIETVYEVNWISMLSSMLKFVSFSSSPLLSCFYDVRVPVMMWLSTMNNVLFYNIIVLPLFLEKTSAVTRIQENSWVQVCPRSERIWNATICWNRFYVNDVYSYYLYNFTQMPSYVKFNFYHG